MLIAQNIANTEQSELNTARFRIRYDGLVQKNVDRRLIGLLQKDLKLPIDCIRKVLETPPRVLWEVPNRYDAENLKNALESMGCRASFEPVVSFVSCPFSIPKHQETFIKKELSKVLRSRTHLTLFLARVESTMQDSVLPSMMGAIEEKLENYFRESDTVIGVDDERILIVGFSTDKSGVSHVRRKLGRVLKELVGKNIKVSVGHSIFPEEARTLPELLHLAETKRHKSQSSGEKQQEEQPPENGSDTSVMHIDPLAFCFLHARGRIFNRLLEMEPGIIWMGLSRLPKVQQMEFWVRLPFNSPIAVPLKRMIDSNARVPRNQTADSRLEAMIRQMEIDAAMEARKKKKKRIVSRLKSIDDLPTLPAVAAQVFRIASNPDFSANELAAVIMNDPALTSKLLKTVNSAYYGNIKKVGTVKKAIVLLGSEEIMDLAFGLAAAKVFDNKALGGLISPKALWHHSICTALIAQNLSRQYTTLNKSGVITAGLLHDIGKIFFIDQFPEDYEKIHKKGDRYNLPLFAVEDDSLGINHADIGRILSSNWNLPEQLVDTISWHHQPFFASGDQDLPAIVGLADYLYHSVMKSRKRKKNKTYATCSIPRLTIGHKIFLARIMKDSELKRLPDMVRMAESVIEKSHDLLSTIK